MSLADTGNILRGGGGGIIQGRKLARSARTETKTGRGEGFGDGGGSPLPEIFLKTAFENAANLCHCYYIYYIKCVHYNNLISQ